MSIFTEKNVTCVGREMERCVAPSFPDSLGSNKKIVLWKWSGQKNFNLPLFSELASRGIHQFDDAGNCNIFLYFHSKLCKFDFSSS